MEPLEFWRLCDHLTREQAALLIVGVDPSTIKEDLPYLQLYNLDRPKGYDAVLAALNQAIDNRQLEAKRVTIAPPDEERVSYWPKADFYTYMVAVEDLKVWLQGRGTSTGFFFPTGPVGDGLNTDGSFNAPKLVAAARAWQAVTGNPSAQRGKSVKRAIKDWLRDHAAEYGLTKEDGSPNETGIEEVAKVANWKTKGGAPKTPGS